MKTGSEYHVGIVGLGSMGMGAALSCIRAGLSTWGGRSEQQCLYHAERSWRLRSF